MKIPPVAVEMFHEKKRTDGRTNRQTDRQRERQTEMTEIIVAKGLKKGQLKNAWLSPEEI